jgi:cytochrome c oxidase assembly protein subunit 15
MQASSAFDLAPVVQLLLLGLALASLVLAWVWQRGRPMSLGERMRRLTLLTLFLTFDLVLFGAFTRLSDSGLGCPDWPGCYGKASPLGAVAEIAAEQARMPGGPVTHRKAWIEMAHRYFAMVVGALIVALALLAWYHANAGRAARLPSPWWPTLTLAWVCLQGAFGALTVSMRLFPLIVALHLMGGMVLLVLLCVQATRYQLWHARRDALDVSTPLRLGLLACAGLLVLQIFLGGWVSANYAVLACADFPTCQASWWPAMDFAQGFTLWRELGLRQDGQPITLPALTAIHFAHRMAALLVAGALLALALGLHQTQALRKPALALALLTLLQLLTGVANVLFGWPLLAALMHTGGAAALVLTLTWIAGSCRARSVTHGPEANDMGQAYRGQT